RALGTAVVDYPSGTEGVLLDPRDPHLARQNPADYLVGLTASVRGALAQADTQAGFARHRVIGIGVDTTGSTPLPVDAGNRPLALDPRWRASPAAQAWLWKDHTAAEEAAAIRGTARRWAPGALARAGGRWHASGRTPSDCRSGFPSRWARLTPITAPWGPASGSGPSSRSSAPRPATSPLPTRASGSPTSRGSVASFPARSCRDATGSKRASPRWAICCGGGWRSCARDGNRCTAS